MMKGIAAFLLTLAMAALMTLPVYAQAGPALGADKPAAQNGEEHFAPEDAIPPVPHTASGQTYTATAVADLSGSIFQAGGFGAESASGGVAALAEDDVRSNIKARIATALTARESDFSFTPSDVSGAFTLAEVQRYYSETVNEHPEFFYLSGRTAFSYSYAESGPEGPLTLVKITPVYDAALNNSAAVDAFHQAADRYLALLDGDMSELEILLTLHDALAVSCSYDLTYERYSAYDALVSGSAVCQGYTLAYRYLLNRLGMLSTTVSSACLNHIWNLVYLSESNRWYHVDITWDDPVADRPGHVWHKNFLLSSSAMAATGHKSNGTTDWQTTYDGNPVVCDSAYDNGAPWTDNCSAIFACGKEMYYMAYTGGSLMLCRSRAEGQTADILVSFPTSWQRYNRPAGNDIATFASLVWDEENFYFNDEEAVYCVRRAEIPAVIAQPMQARKIYSFPGTDDLFGMTLCNGILQVYSSPDPGLSAPVYTATEVSVRASEPDVPLDAAHFPDESFRAALALYDIDGSGSLSDAELASVTALRLSDEAIAGLAGIEYFTALKSLDLSGCTSLTQLDGNAFSGCTALAEITLPAAMASVKAGAFSGCTALKTVRFMGTEAEWAAVAIAEGNEPLTDAAILCSDTVFAGLVGDVNGDGVITAGDSQYLQEYLVGNAALSGPALQLADAYQDSVLSVTDVQSIMEYITGCIPALPYIAEPKLSA